MTALNQEVYAQEEGIEQVENISEKQVHQSKRAVSELKEAANYKRETNSKLTKWIGNLLGLGLGGLPTGTVVAAATNETEKKINSSHSKRLEEVENSEEKEENLDRKGIVLLNIDGVPKVKPFIKGYI